MRRRFDSLLCPFSTRYPLSFLLKKTVRHSCGLRTLNSGISSRSAPSFARQCRLIFHVILPKRLQELRYYYNDYAVLFVSRCGSALITVTVGERARGAKGP